MVPYPLYYGTLYSEMGLCEARECAKVPETRKSPVGSPQATGERKNFKRKDTMLTTLGRHIDGLTLSVSFPFPAGLDALLTAAKTEVQESGDDLGEYCDWMPGVPGGTWYIRPRGRDKVYHYVLENAAFYVAINSKLEQWPQLEIQFKASTLYEYDAADYASIVDRLVRFLIGPSLVYKHKVSRLDLCVDFQEQGFKLPKMSEVITRARKRYKVYRGDTANTLTLGARHGALQSQIYCKSEELLVSEKSWMFEVWRAAGGYDEELPVWRCEVRFFRSGLKSFGLDTLDEVLVALGDLVRYAVSDSAGGWLRVVTEDSRSLKDTSARPSSPWWSAICSAFSGGDPPTGCKRKGYDPRPSYQRSVELAGAHLARAASFLRLGEHKLDLSPAGIGRIVGAKYSELLTMKGSSWSERVNIKTAELRSNVWIAKAPDFALAT